MDSLKPWLRAVAIKLLSTFTERKADDQFRTGLKEASVCRDGETIRVRIDELTARSSNVVQIVEVGDPLKLDCQTAPRVKAG